MNKIIEEDFECLDKHITKALTFDKDNVYKISDFIELLQKAMEKYGDTLIMDDGTKIRRTNDDEFVPDFAENMDIKITNKCNMNCPMCHEGST